MRRRVQLLSLAALCGLVAACDLDETAGLSQVLGDPLLDITLGPAPDGRLPTGTFAINTRRDTLRITLDNLPVLPEGRRYQVYLVDSAGRDGSALDRVAVGGRLITETRSRRPVNRDTIVPVTRFDTVASAIEITQADTNNTFRLTVVNPELPNFTHVVVAVVGGPQTSPIDASSRFGFLSGRYFNGATYTNSGTLTLGSWSVTSARRVPFNAGAASVQGSFRGGTVRLNIRDLIRPPEGFQYAGWLIDERTGDAVRLGGLQTPVPLNQPLTDADVAPTSTYLSDVAIVDAQLRGDSTAGGGVRWEDFTRIVVLLEPKGGTPPARPSGAYVLNGVVPNSVASRFPNPGKLTGTVTSSSGASVTGATVYLSGTGTPDPRTGLVTNADAEGRFRYNTLAIGRYRAYVIPRGATAPTDSEDVVIARVTRNGQVVGDSVAITLTIP